MPELDLVRFETSSWQPHGEEADVRRWVNATMPDQLSLHYFPKIPDIPVPLTELDELRSFYRDVAITGGLGLISVDLLQLRGVSTIRLIVRSRQQLHGMTYLASLTFPFADFSYVAKIQCAEHGTTGVREAVVFDKWLRTWPAKDPLDMMAEFSRDPYDPSRRDQLMRNAAEDESLDTQFPGHPLSRVRKYLSEIESTIEFDPAIGRATPFRPAQRG